MRVNSRGQITIPVRIREMLGLRPGTELEVSVEGEGIVLRRPWKDEEHEELGESLSDEAHILLTREEILALSQVGS